MQEDSIEHYAGCAVCLQFLRGTLHYHGRVDRGHLIVLGANSGSQTDEDFCKLALWAFVLYKAFNQLRSRQGSSLQAGDVLGLMTQHLRDGVCGHKDATKLLSNAWRQDFRFQDLDADLSDEDRDIP